MEFPKQFISAGHEACSYKSYIPAPYLRKSFTAESPPQKAEILITGLGFYDLSVNGQRITKGICAPYISNPDHFIYYDRYDVTNLIHSGENVIGIILGNGMQNAFDAHFFAFDQAAWVAPPMTALCIEITDETGHLNRLESDDAFKYAPSPIRFDQLRTGEFYDARCELTGWDRAGFDDSGWNHAVQVKPPRGEAVLCELPPVVTVKELEPVAVYPVDDDSYVFDFGENGAGLCRLTINGKPGQKIVMRHGESLQDGKVSQKSTTINYAVGHSDLDRYYQTDVYVCRGGGEETYVPRFTYHGFQYVSVTGITPDQAAAPGLLTYLVMNSALDEAGDFTCSDATINTLQVLTRRSTLANFYYFPTDCPHREKNGWTSDAALSAEHTLLNLTPEEYYREWLRNVRKAMSDEGALPGIIPTGGWGFQWGNGPAWDRALIDLPYFTYIYRGNRAILEENAAAIFRYLHYLSTVIDHKGLVRIGLGDWCQPNRTLGIHDAPLEFTDTVSCMDICKKSAYIFGELGMISQKEFAESLYVRLRCAARERLVNLSTMTAVGNCQTTQAMAIFYEVFDPGETPAAFEVLLRLIECNGRRIGTGILGGRVIFHVLSAFGRTDLAFEMITTPEFPSYGNWVARGASSLWESFLPEGADVGSLNHHFWGDISSWFIKWLAGIQLNPFGFGVNEVHITPKFIDALDHASGYHIAPAGKIQVDWKRTGNEIELMLEIPQGMTGQIVLESPYVFSDGSAAKLLFGGSYRILKN